MPTKCIISYEEIEKAFGKFQSEREEKLKKIKRYGNYKTMFYRTDVFFHSHKVAYLLESHFDYIKKNINFDHKKAIIMAIIHDDEEIITGDFQSAQKNNMSKQELKKQADIEIQGIEKISKLAPEKILGYNYKSLLLEIHEKNTPESELVKFIDHIDGFGEALYEIYGGNISFTEGIENKNYGLVPSPTIHYINRFNNLTKLYPLLNTIIEVEKLPYFKDLTKQKDFLTIAKTSKKHTIASLDKKFDHDILQRRTKNLLTKMTDQEKINLIEAKE